MKSGKKFDGLWWSKFFFISWLIVSLMAPFLANDQPIITKDKLGVHIFPEVTTSKSKIILSAPIPYRASTIDLENSNAVSPFEKQTLNSIQYRHWLGTDGLGRDVLANLIYGSQTALVVGFGAMAIAALIGVLLGCLAAYFGDHKLLFSWPRLILVLILQLTFILTQFFLIPWDVQAVSWVKKIGLFLSVTSLYIFAIIFMNYYFIKWEKKRVFKSPKSGVNIPLDLIIGRIIEIMDAIPLLFLIIALSAVFNPSITTVIFIIGVSSWAGIARYARAETLKIMNLGYIESTNALGFPPLKIIRTHILPNAIGPVLVSLSFGIAAAILIEATLSFIGMGLSTDAASWGKLIAEARTNYGAWWLAIFPGLAIFFTVLSCNTLGDKLISD